MEIQPLLELMVKHGASDLFFSTGAPVNIKIEGKSQPVGQDILQPGQVHNLAYSLMNEKQIKQFEAELEMNLGVSFSGIGRFRINCYFQRGEVSMVVRYVKPTPVNFSDLNLPDFLSGFVMQNRGLILVAGATGSGKSTSLAAMIDYRNTHATGHILTIEDPIEYIHKHKKSVVDQREVGCDTVSYENALKNAMREAPDVILIGEVRDLTTMKQAIAYSETGHLCLTTIHAANACETLDRILNLYPQDAHHQLLLDLSRNLVAIVCQRLVRGVDNRRIPCLEVMVKTPYIQELIQNGKLDEMRSVMERKLDKHTSTFDDNLFALYEEGKISEQEALSNADSRHNVKVKMRLGGSGNEGDHLDGGLSLQ